MKLSALKTVLLAASKTRKRILIVSPPGMGKTALVKEVRNELQCKMFIFYASVSDPCDFKGFYCLVNGKPEIMPFGDLERIYNATELTIVFLDDFGQGPNATQAASMSFLDRVKDNPNVWVIAATNGKGDKANVSGMLEPVKSRFDSIINVEFDLDDFTEYMLNKNAPVELIAFNKFRSNLIYSQKPSTDLVNSPIPRTVDALGELIKLTLPEELEHEVYSGAVGEAYAIEFLAFMRNYRKYPKVDQILCDPENAPLPDEPSIIYAVTLAISNKVSEITLENAFKYLSRVSSDFIILFIRQISKFKPELCDTKSYIQFTAKNKNLII